MINLVQTSFLRGFPGGSDGKESIYNAGNPGSISGSGRYPGEGNGYPFQYSCLENPINTGDLWARVHGVLKSQTLLSDFFFFFSFLKRPAFMVHGTMSPLEQRWVILVTLQT